MSVDSQRVEMQRDKYRINKKIIIDRGDDSNGQVGLFGGCEYIKNKIKICTTVDVCKFWRLANNK